MNIFGLKPSKKLQGLISELGKLYGKAVVFRNNEDLPKVEKVGPKPLGACRVEYGVPVVYIHLQKGLNEEIIAHELLHLKLGKEGFPRTRYPEGTLEAIAGSELLSIIEHRLIYIELSRIGFNPYESFKENVESTFVPDLRTKNPYPEYRNITRRIIFSIWYARVELELKDEETKRTIDEWYSKEEKEARTLGKNLANAIRQERLDSPRMVLKVFKSCLIIINAPPSMMNYIVLPDSIS